MIVLFLLFSFVEAKLPDYEMQRYCKDRVVSKYKIKRSAIHLAVPRYLYGKYSVYGQSPKNSKNALFFVCDFSKNGKLLAVKTQEDSRNKTKVSSKIANRSCISEASSVWGVKRSNIKTNNIKRVKSSRFHISLSTRNKTASCDVNAQGNIYSFKTKREQNSKLTKRARQACFLAASKYWKIPSHRLSINKIKTNKYRRYNVIMQYRNTRGRCDVDRYGYIHHFKTLRR
jgi:hypothetical protein